MNVFLLEKTGLQEGEWSLFETWLRRQSGTVCIVAHAHEDQSSRVVLETLKMHPLAIQDVLRDRHPPKYEVFQEYAILVLRVLPQHHSHDAMTPVQVNIAFGNQWLFCRYRHLCPSVETLLSGFRHKKQSQPAELLAWEMMSLVGIQYLDWLMVLERRIGILEDMMLRALDDRVLGEVVSLKTLLRKYRRNFLYLERMAGHIRDKGLGRDVVPHSPECNDLYEKWERVYSMSAMFYEQLGDMVDGYISQSSYKLNVTMRVLTVITAIFIPLSFIAAVYGMNFTYMPELQYRWGYFGLLGIMVLIAVVMVVWFRRIKWL